MLQNTSDIIEFVKTEIGAVYKTATLDESGITDIIPTNRIGQTILVTFKEKSLGEASLSIGRVPKMKLSNMWDQK